MSIGAQPARIKWNVVRGDTSVLRIEFYEKDEKSFYDTEGWTFLSSVYDRQGRTLSSLDVDVFDGYITITATPEISETWGSGFRDRVAQLDFDVQVTIDEEVIWTPIIGIISVIGDVTGRTL
jgi:hypothetical protein